MLLMVVVSRAAQVGVRPLYKSADTARLEQTDTDSAGALPDRPEEKRNTCRTSRHVGTGCYVGLSRLGLRNSNDTDHDRPSAYAAG